MSKITVLELSGRVRLNDMETLATAFLKELERDQSCYDTWCVNDKRVFGNSDLFGDIIELLDIKMDGNLYQTPDKTYVKAETVTEYVESLWSELGPYINNEWSKRKNV